MRRKIIIASSTAANMEAFIIQTFDLKISQNSFCSINK